MRIETFQGGFDKNLSHLIWCEETGIAGLIDASVETPHIFEQIENYDLVLEKILITHTHYDHISFLDDLRYQFPAAQICGFENPESDLGVGCRRLTHNEIISLGGEMFTVLHTPGHYPDSICFWNKNAECVFTGDTLFVGRTGRTVGSRSNISNLYQSIYKILLQLPDRTIIHPGHHYGHVKSIKISENMKISPFFQCSTEKEFQQVMAEFERNRKRG